MKESYGARIILFCGAVSSTCDGIHYRRDVIAFCLYLMKKSGGLSLSSLFVCFYKYNRNNRLVTDEEGKQSNCGGRVGGG